MQSKRDEVLKEELARKVEEKNDKMTAIEEQRRALMAELDKARKEIAAHDDMLRVWSCNVLSFFSATGHV